MKAGLAKAATPIRHRWSPPVFFSAAADFTCSVKVWSGPKEASRSTAEKLDHCALLVEKEEEVSRLPAASKCHIRRGEYRASPEPDTVM